MTRIPLHMNRRLVAFAALALAFALAASGCLFDTRPAQPPDTGEKLVIFDQPQKVFEGMKVGLEQDNSNYDRAFGDNYFFSPLPQDSLDPTFDATTFSGWNRDVEVATADLLRSDADTIQVTFSPEEKINSNTFVKYSVDYVLRVVLKSGGASTTYRATADIGVERVEGIWQIRYWDETIPDDTAPSWGYLRGTLRQRL